MNDQSKTRISLILRLRSPADAVAWREFVEIYQPLVFRLARNRGLQDADALDAVQEVFARVAKAINRWDPDPNKGTFRGWISRITRNLVIEMLRSKSRRPLTGDDSAIAALLDAAPRPSAESELFDLERERQLFAWAADKVRQTAQPKSWQAFWLTAVEHHSIEDAAAELNMSKGAVYVARSRMMARLKQVVQQHLQSSSATDASHQVANPLSDRSQR